MAFLKVNKLYLSVVFGKKESRYPHGNLGRNQLNTATPTSVVSIADLVCAVNPSEENFQKYFPDSMLNSEQIESKNKALTKKAEKVENLKTSTRQTENVKAFSLNVQNDSAGVEASDDIVAQGDKNVNLENSDLKKDDISFKSKSEGTNGGNSLGETSSMDSVSQNNKNVNPENSDLKKDDASLSSRQETTDDKMVFEQQEHRKRSLAAAENANALLSTPKATNSTASDDIVTHNNSKCQQGKAM